MKPSLLILTSQPGFGDHIRQILEQSRAVDITVVDDADAAVYEFRNKRFTHVFLDKDLKNGSILDVGLALRKMNPDLKLIIIAARQSNPRFDALQPWSFLPKPFFIPDLLRVMADDAISPLPRNPVKDTPAAQPEKLSWLQDVDKAAQHLTRLSLESSAQASLIIRNSSMWAYAGHLNEAAAREAVQVINRDKKEGDLLKFLRLNITQAEHMLYATNLTETAVLAMVFDAETPFSAIRQQATNLAEALTVSLQDTSTSVSEIINQEDEKDDLLANKDESELRELFAFDDGENYDAGEGESALRELFDFDESRSGAEEKKKETGELFAFDDFDDFDDDGDEDDLPLISDILDSIPEPNPVKASLQKDKAADVAIATEKPKRESMPNPFARENAQVVEEEKKFVSREAAPAIRAEQYFESHQRLQDELAETRVQEKVKKHKPYQYHAQHPESAFAETRVSTAARPETPTGKPSPEELVETRPSPVQKTPERRVTEEPVTGNLYDLSFACLLVPRFSTHRLVGDLSSKLSDWMPNICIAFGWRLEHLAVRPNYLQWVVNVPPSTSPGYLMRIMRKQTSDRIFADFPQQKQENPSGDFWAPGYLIMGGSQPHPASLVEDYIKRTRDRQGV